MAPHTNRLHPSGRAAPKSPTLRRHSAATAPQKSPRAAVAASPTTTTTTTTTVATPFPHGSSPVLEADVVVIGSGLGGLSAAALCARYGLSVTLIEAHKRLGGACHHFTRDGFRFESGPSLFSGMADATGRGANPMAHVLKATGADAHLEYKRYDTWRVHLPEGTFDAGIGPDASEALVSAAGGSVDEWRALSRALEPLAAAATAVPALALRADVGALWTAGLRNAPAILASAPHLPALTRPASAVADAVGLAPRGFVRRWFDLLCFLLSGHPAAGTPAAEVAFMWAQWYRPGASLEFPVGGAAAVAEALARTVVNRGGSIFTSAQVKRISLDASGRATGVEVVAAGGDTVTTTVRARRAVVSGASVWDTAALLGEGRGGGEGSMGAAATSPAAVAAATPALRSFMHLHAALEDDAWASSPSASPPMGPPSASTPGLHHLVVDSWEAGVDAPGAVSLISIPSTADPGMAPRPGTHCLHAYYPASEPWGPWSGVTRGTPAYNALKEERVAGLRAAVARAVPGYRDKLRFELVGTPVTHARYLRRHAGTYGPAWSPEKGQTFPGPGALGVQGLLLASDSAFPGIGVPAVAAAGAVAASTIAGMGPHMKMLRELGI